MLARPSCSALTNISYSRLNAVHSVEQYVHMSGGHGSYWNGASTVNPVTECGHSRAFD